MSTRELWQEIMHYGSFDRMPVFHWTGWDETRERWRSEGMPDFPNTDAERVWFGAEAWFYGVGTTWHGGKEGAKLGLYPAFETEVLEETDAYRIIRQDDGVVCKDWKKKSSIPHFIDFTLKDADGWDTYKERLQPNPARIPCDLEEQIQAAEASGLALGAQVTSLTGWIRNWMGVENMSYLFQDDPDVYADMVMTLADLSCWWLDIICPKIELDMVFGWEDICGKTGPLVSPKVFDQHVAAGYQKVRSKLKEHGVKLYCIDTDGDISALCGRWLDAGVNMLYPFEIGTWQADPWAYRQKHSRELRIVGGIDKRVLALGREAIDAEIERRLPLMKDGGYLAMPDHLIPPDVPLDDYRYYLDRIRELRI